MAKSLLYYRDKLQLIKSTIDKLLPEIAQEIIPRQKRSKKDDNDFAEYERALITGKRLRKPKEIRKT